MNPIEQHEELRRNSTEPLDRGHRSRYGQFFTPEPVARYMASLLNFSPSAEVRLLDPGCGVGSLTAAVARQFERRLYATCYELEPSFQAGLQRTLSGLANVHADIRMCDFIQHSILQLSAGESPCFTHAILNPPYKKINVHSTYRELVRKLGLETSNLYTCFLACSIALCRPGAQVVAIIPRSFMNGPYFKPFRMWLLGRVAITNIHVFDRRDRAFSEDDVLQENVIVKMVVGAKPGPVAISMSSDQAFNDLNGRSCPFEEVVFPGDDEQFIHIPTVKAGNSKGLPGVTLRELGVDVCTGPVVDFRLREYLRKDPATDTVPLLYASHFTGGRFEWPKAGKKPNAIVRHEDTERWLMPRGCYVVVRRFTSKEEKRRIVASLLLEDSLASEMIGFENHLNIIHCGRKGLPQPLAKGLAAYLNSQQVDDYFRSFSGHTQVNATDLRRMHYPTVKELIALGRNT